MSFAARMMAPPPVTTPAVSLPASISVQDYQYQTDAEAAIYVVNDGTYYSVGSVSAPFGTWLNLGAASDYEIRFSPTSGSVSSGDSVNTWLSLSVQRAWFRNQVYTGTILASSSVQGTLEIRNAATQAVLASSTVTLLAETTNLNPP